MTQASQVYTVTRLNSAVRMLLEHEIGTVWLNGEISNLAMPASGHWYFSLKDLSSQVRCAMFKGSNRRVPLRPRDGMQVLVQARVSLFEPRGDYQLIVESMQPAGDGVLAMRFEELKQRLTIEGLFDAGRKRPLPAQPRAVGIITSATGAALHDMLTVLRRRAPSLPVIIYPTQVQGQAAIGQIVHALYTANRRAEVDVIILGRGGGSLEDLWCFNEEAVARAIAQSTIPVVSAVGHEVDVTISDFVADLRAPTPSAAAELVAPDQGQLRERLGALDLRLRRSALQLLQGSRHRLTLLAKRLEHRDPQRTLEQQSQRLDELALRLERQMSRQLQGSERRLAQLAQRLERHTPARHIEEGRRRHQLAGERLTAAMTRQLAGRSHRIGMLAARLDGVSPLATLGRGYAILRDEAGKVVTSPRDTRVGARLSARLAEGGLTLSVEELE
ncbi:exodeoxyribonuclease VII large subunit [Aeromonas diversa CDC 2478-85]|uniref:Exodeoxyribonuclease 7 large subunit n=1 Tax=Aeromonas diversa CDC 2478-85 TaxID=1268237 RepID=N9VGV7_9GAMM|nr:exodeoxyribonuclease VII large subunit [Aeromonas diversa]ENY70621.1 exodeoxyribonuclease VII large subunit [Aeromonas diversa CDC 2478-85]